MGKRKNTEQAGAFDRGEYFAQIADEYFYPEVTKGLSAGERAILLRLTRVTMGSADDPTLTLEVRTSISFLMKFEPYRKTAIKEFLDSLEDRKLIRKTRVDHKHGNSYFIEPVYLVSGRWHLFAGIENSRLAQLVAKRPTCDESKLSWSEIGQQ